MASEEIEELLRLHNEARGGADLTIDSRLAEAAHGHAEHMARNRVLSHRGRLFSSVSSRVRNTGYPMRSVAENIAAGQQTPEDVMASWIASRGHRRNILGRYHHVGFGRSGNYWCAVFASGA